MRMRPKARGRQKRGPAVTGLDGNRDKVPIHAITFWRVSGEGLRKLNVWGAFMFGLAILLGLEGKPSADPTDVLSAAIGVGLLYFGFSLYFGVQGNELTAKNYLDLGWQFANPDEAETKAAKLAWGIKI